MNKMESITLKGPCTSKRVAYKNPDIIVARINQTPMYANQFQLKWRNGKIYLYHSFDGANDFIGRYYDVNFNPAHLRLRTNGVLRFPIPNYEDESTGRRKTVQVSLTLSDSGIRKLQKFSRGV